MLRTLTACAVVTLVFAAADWVSANPPVAPAPAPTVTYQGTVQSPAAMRATERQAIRQMPLLMRPNRPGHFYGNTVRRLYYGR